MSKTCKDCDWFGYTDDVLECRLHPFHFKEENDAICAEFKEKNSLEEARNSKTSDKEKLQQISKLVSAWSDQAFELDKIYAKFGDTAPNGLIAKYQAELLRKVIIELCKILVTE